MTMPSGARWPFFEFERYQVDALSGYLTDAIGTDTTRWRIVAGRGYAVFAAADIADAVHAKLFVI